ncbi:hypothetical protein [Streptomyces longispororuber]|uniref:hypothetical protein n=1 Tax=Streptomyces longispororuber TaxID=68230 RepID=UPI0036F5F96C
MAVTAPGSRGSHRPHRIHRPHGTRGGSHGNAGARALSHVLAAPVLLALVYGLWTATNDRKGGSVTVGNVVLGIVSGVVLGALYMALRRLAPALPRELRAPAWGALAGVSVGFLYSLTEASLLRSVGVGAAAAAGVAAATYYYFATHE